MQRRLTGLLLPLILAGCVSHGESKHPIATVYVDGLIADSAATIGQAQTALNQTGPWPVRPQSPVSQLPTVTPANKASRQVMPHLLFTGRPEKPGFPKGAMRLYNVTLNHAVQRTVPRGWQVSWSPDALHHRYRRVNVSLNDQWTRVLDTLMASQSLCATADWADSKVIISTCNVQAASGIR